MAKSEARQRKEAHQERVARDEAYSKFNVEPTELEDGTVARSRLEALWVAEFDSCENLECVECVQVPVWIKGPYGDFLSNYRPDLVVQTSSGRIFVELKPNHELCMDDDRAKRALELNPKYKFVILGGYPYSKRGVTVRMLTGKKEIVHEKVPVCEVLKLMECDCG